MLLQVAKAIQRVVEKVHDRLPADSALAIGLARLWTKGDKPFFQLITENKDTPKQVRLSCHEPNCVVQLPDIRALASLPSLVGYRVVCFVVWLTAPNAVVAKKSFS